MPSRFVHLHVHSHYSLLQALPKVKAILKQAKTYGMDTIALTDNGVFYGVIEFYQKALDEGVKPIIGMDAYLSPFGMQDRRAKIDHKPFRLVLLAEHNVGYHNLMKISTAGFLEGFFLKPRVDKAFLRSVCEQSNHGLIALSGGFYSEIAVLIRQGEEAKAVEVIKEFQEIFGPNNFFLELVDRPELPDVQAVNSRLIALGRELNVPLVVTKDANYLQPSDAEAWKILACIQGGKKLEDFEREHPFEFDASLCSAEEIESRFSDVPDAIENTRIIADRCNVHLELGKWNFANIDIPGGETAQSWLTKRAHTELGNKVLDVTPEMLDRLDYELSVIEKKGFAPYFLIVSDYIEWARRNGIVTTTRGSAAGSLVSFAIGISTVNPLTYGLPFERFLNPERPSAPDVDGDFADNRREEMLEYVTQKYGADKVAQICTFGTMMARGSVRDVGRALGYPYRDCDRIAKLIPHGSQGFPMSLKRALDESPELGELYKTNRQIQRLIDLAMRIEGCARHVSIHAAGVVFSPTPLTDFTPLQRDSKEGHILTQYEMHAVESAGLLKMDFLGIRNLSILGDAIALANKVNGANIMLEKIPVDDSRTFELLAHGKTMGVFQLGGSGMTRYLMDLKPERVEDIMAMVALYRPGPMESIPEYIARKHNPELITYLDPRLSTILVQSYGIITYQDDVMLIAIHLGGYSWLEADKLRKAMGKKIPEEMAAQKEKLLKGLIVHGKLSKSVANRLWKLIEPFAAYGFNKSHAASYGMVAYQTAYMKANYPAIYMTALMTAESADLKTIAEAVHECDRLGIEVLPPDVNESRKNFTYIDDTRIRFGLLAIKNLGAEVIEMLVAEREANGLFKDLSDFGRRAPHRVVSKKAFEALIKVGALDRFGERRQLLEHVDQIIFFNKQAEMKRAQNQVSFFDLAPEMGQESFTMRQTPSASRMERLTWERELLGLYVSAHPTESFLALEGDVIGYCGKVPEYPDGTFVRVAVSVSEIKTIFTKKQEMMAFVTIEDVSGVAELIVFPRTLTEHKEQIVEGAILLVSTKVSEKDGEKKLICNSLIPITEENTDDLLEMVRTGSWIATSTVERLERSSPPSSGGGREVLGVEIVLHGKPSQDMIADLRAVFEQYPGIQRVSLMVESAGQWRRVQTEYAIADTPEALRALRAIVGNEYVKVR
ncbi:MAG: DNA polymerase III subunit alpha [Patescibacteria group bacterium]